MYEIDNKQNNTQFSMKVEVSSLIKLMRTHNI